MIKMRRKWGSIPVAVSFNSIIIIHCWHVTRRMG